MHSMKPDQGTWQVSRRYEGRRLGFPRRPSFSSGSIRLRPPRHQSPSAMPALLRRSRLEEEIVGSRVDGDFVVRSVPFGIEGKGVPVLRFAR